MNKQEAKEFILNNWNVSSGKRITEMLKRYFDLKEPDIVEQAKEIFHVNDIQGKLG